MGYEILLLDADNTLLDFDRAEDAALRETFARYGLPFDEQVKEMYETVNHRLWEAYENGEIEHHVILERRFRDVFAQMGVTDPLAGFEQEYQLALGRGGYLLPGALDVCRALCRTHRLYIATNGVERTQNTRLDASGLRPFLSGVFISDVVGSQKPQKEYYDYVAAHIPGWDPAKVLMVGDSLNSDMRGGEVAGVANCWYNPERKMRPAGIRIDYEIARLEELPAVAEGGGSCFL